MNRRRHDGRRWLMRGLRGIVALLVLLLLVFVLVQLLLSTSWARKKAATKVSQRIGGLPVEIADLGWTPWSGVEIEGLEVAQPEKLRDSLASPLVEIDRIRVAPDYRLALKGEVAFHELRIDRPRVHASVEMLVSIAASSLPPAEPPVIAAKTGGEEVQAPQKVKFPEAAGESSGPAEKPASAAEREPERESPPKPSRKRVRVTLEDGAFELVRAGVAERLAAIEGVDLDLPVFGEPGESENLLGLVELNGKALEKDLAFRTESAGTTLRFLFPERETSGMTGYLAIGLKAGVPFQADFGFRLDGVDPVDLHPLATVGCGRMESRMQGVGWLQAPGSWSGFAGIEASDVSCRLAGTPVRFDRASGRLNLSRGVLSSPGFRLTGDSGALLGNGWVTASDASSVVRVVVPYPIVGMMNEELSERVRDGVFAFRPLDPGNRWYSDVSIWRREDDWMAGFGQDGSVVPVGDLLKGE